MKRGFKKQKHEFFLNTIGTDVDFREVAGLNETIFMAIQSSFDVCFWPKIANSKKSSAGCRHVLLTEMMKFDRSQQNSSYLNL